MIISDEVVRYRQILPTGADAGLTTTTTLMFDYLFDLTTLLFLEVKRFRNADYRDDDKDDDNNGIDDDDMDDDYNDNDSEYEDGTNGT